MGYRVEFGYGDTKHAVYLDGIFALGEIHIEELIAIDHFADLIGLAPMPLEVRPFRILEPVVVGSSYLPDLMKMIGAAPNIEFLLKIALTTRRFRTLVRGSAPGSKLTTSLFAHDYSIETMPDAARAILKPGIDNRYSADLTDDDVVAFELMGLRNFMVDNIPLNRYDNRGIIDLHSKPDEFVDLFNFGIRTLFEASV